MHLIFSDPLVTLLIGRWAADAYGSVLDGVRALWAGFGDAQGFVAGVFVALLVGVMNNRALKKLEKQRDDLEVKRNVQTWERDRAEKLREDRRSTYAELMAYCERHALIDLVATSDEHRKQIFSDFYGVSGRVRLVTDDEILIAMVDELVDAAVNIETKQQRFNDARTGFVRLARKELGLKPIEVRTSTKLGGDGPDHEMFKEDEGAGGA